MKLNEEKINGSSSFDYIRILFSLEDEKFDELINDYDFKIKPLFSMNLIYPFGQLNEVGGKELWKTCVFFSEVEMTYYFISQNCENNKFTNLLDDIRISLQNFLILLNFRSYHSAFSELRKVLEGVLYILFMLLIYYKNLYIYQISLHTSFRSITIFFYFIYKKD